MFWPELQQKVMWSLSPETLRMWPRIIGSGGFARGFLLSSFRVAFDPSFSQRCIPKGSASRFEYSVARISDAFRCKDHPRVEVVDVVATSVVAPSSTWREGAEKEV